MTNLVILCVEDEPEVRDALVRDIQAFASTFRIEEAEDVEDARSVVADCLSEDDELALVLCDHLLPGTSGVEFLVELNKAPQTQLARKVLVTGQAGLDDTIQAVNKADLHAYIAKPWSRIELEEVVRRLLTDYVIDEADDLLPFVNVLDAPLILEALKQREVRE